MTGYRRKLEQNFFCSIVDQEKKAFYYVYMLRKEGNCMEKEIMQCTTSGQRRRGRPRTRWQDNLTKWTGLTGDRLLRSVEDRRQRRKITHETASPRIEDGWSVCVFYQWYSYVLLALGDLRVCSLYRRTHSRSRLAWVGDRLAPF